MPKTKLKSRKTVVKRFKTSANGKLMRGHTGLNHLMRKKDKNRRRELLNDAELYKGDRKRITSMMGPGKRTPNPSPGRDAIAAAKAKAAAAETPEVVTPE